MGSDLSFYGWSHGPDAIFLFQDIQRPMNERFHNPPLVELVAELRWNDPSLPTGLPIGFPAGFPFPGSQIAFDQQLPEMTSAMTSLGFGQSERLIPPGFPAPLQSPIVRFRYSGPAVADHEQLPSSLFQIGSGIFTANAVKPYKSWDDFKPVVENGVRILLQTQKADVGGYTLTLRYINAFREDLTQGLSHFEFVRNVLGFKIDLPPVLLKHAEGKEVELPLAQLVVPLSFGILQLQMSQGEIEGGPAYILENVVQFKDLVDPDVDTIMQCLSSAREVIHEVFISLSAPLRDKMLPAEVER